MKHRANLLVILALAVLCAIAYSNSFYKDFQYDDVRLIRFNFALRNPEDLKAIFSFEPFRSLSTASYAIDFAISGKEPVSYHVTNILLHFCNMAVFFLLLRRLSDNLVFCAIAAALMAVHPLNTESVTYIASRSILLCSLFYLLSLFVFDSFLRSERKYYLLLFFLIFSLALLSKEEAVMIPFVALLYNQIFFGRGSLRKYRLFHIVTIGLVLLAGALRIASHLRFTPEPFPVALSVYWPTQIYVWLRYLWLAIFPVQLNLNHAVSPLHFYSLLFFASLAAVLLVLAGLALVAKRSNKGLLVTFWGLWFFLNLLPSSILPLNDYMAEHRTYISLFGFCAILGYLVIVFSKPSGKPSPVIMAALLFQICFYTGATLKRNQVWHDEISLWTDSVKKSPGSIPSRMNLASAYIRDLQFDNAAREYLFVLSGGARIPGAYSGLGYVFLNERNFAEAERNFRKALSVDPQFTDARTGLGILAYEQNRCNEALDYFRQVYDQRRESTDLMRMMAECSLDLRDYDSALLYVRRGAELQPEESYWRKRLRQIDLLVSRPKH